MGEGERGVAIGAVAAVASSMVSAGVVRSRPPCTLVLPSHPLPLASSRKRCCPPGLVNGSRARPVPLSPACSPQTTAASSRARRCSGSSSRPRPRTMPDGMPAAGLGGKGAAIPSNGQGACVYVCLSVAAGLCVCVCVCLAVAVAARIGVLTAIGTARCLAARLTAVFRANKCVLTCATQRRQQQWSRRGGYCRLRAPPSSMLFLGLRVPIRYSRFSSLISPFLLSPATWVGYAFEAAQSSALREG